jgi:DNA mismatch endonuclease (patch repair protein)
VITDPETSARLGQIRQRGTSAEKTVGVLLRSGGLRWGRSKRRLPGSPDFANLSAGWCVFVHGCFWHAHRGCVRATLPKRNRAFWEEKFEANRLRDARVVRSLRKRGMRVIVVWECHALSRPEAVLRRLKRELGAG